MERVTGRADTSPSESGEVGPKGGGSRRRGPSDVGTTGVRQLRSTKETLDRVPTQKQGTGMGG